MPYNAMYERLVDQVDNTIEGYVAYGLYKHSKREWLRKFEADHEGRGPTIAELEAYVDAYTPQLVDALRTQAAGVLVAFADEAVNDATPGILREALRGSKFTAIWTAMLAAFLYTLFLLIVLFVLKHAGVDIISLANTVG